MEQETGQDNQWCKISSLHDNYEGFIQSSSCELSTASSTHRVTAKATLVFEQPDIKSTVVRRLLFGSQFALQDDDTNEKTINQHASNKNTTTDVEANDKFIALRTGGFVWAEHCRDKAELSNQSIVDIARNHYLHSPYLWGGRSTDGCDCSGLVQMVAMAKGVSLPRDSGDQEAAIESDVDYAHRAAEHLVYWPGHVGILMSANDLIHATAHSLQCCIEPLQAVINRAGMPGSIKRIF